MELKVYHGLAGMLMIDYVLHVITFFINHDAACHVHIELHKHSSFMRPTKSRTNLFISLFICSKTVPVIAQYQTNVHTLSFDLFSL